MISLKDNTFGQNAELKNNDQRTAFRNGLSITVKDFVQRSGQIPVHFIDDPERREYKSTEDELILEAYTQKNELSEDNFLVNTANYIGTLFWDMGSGKKLEIEIGSRFSDKFLRRMVSFANDIYISSEDEQSVSSKGKDTAEFILYYLFTQALEKAFLLGVPKSYQSISYKEAAVKGRIDINQLIKDLPFQGKVASVARERVEDQSIINILNKAVSVVSKYEHLKRRLLHIIPFLKQHRTNELVSRRTIHEALASKALMNVMFQPYRRVLKQAEMVLEKSGAFSSSSDRDGVSYLLNVAELFEVYVTKLLVLHFPDWSVSSPKHHVYQDNFFSRGIIPDIVMQQGDRVIVFDTKYKRMQYRGTRQNVWDVDRNDFFQIHTYMTYYQNAPGINLIGGGLIYPLSKPYDKDIAFSNAIFGNESSWFCVDGIKVPDKDSDENIETSETQFIDRIRRLIEADNAKMKQAI